MTEDSRNVRKLISVRSQYGKWKSYDIVFDDKSHWDNWIDKMWDYGYKLESVYEYINCSECKTQHIPNQCPRVCSGCGVHTDGEVNKALNGNTLCTSCYQRQTQH